MWRAWLELARISNLPTVWTNVLAGYVLAGGNLQAVALLWLLIGASLLYTGGMFLNDAADAKWDREHRAERPITIGRVGERTVWLVAAVFLLGGFAIVVWGAGANWRISLGLLAAIVFYDLYHKPWKGAVVVMGACRMLLYWVAFSVAGVDVFDGSDGSFIAFLKSFALGCYVVGLTLAARGEAAPAPAGKQNGGRLLGLLLLAMPGVVAIATEGISPGMGMLLIVLLAVGHWAFVMKICRLMQQKPPSNIGRAVGLLLAGIPFVDALAIISLSPIMAALFIASMPLLRVWQRKIAAT